MLFCCIYLILQHLGACCCLPLHQQVLLACSRQCTFGKQSRRCVPVDLRPESKNQAMDTRHPAGNLPAKQSLQALCCRCNRPCRALLAGRQTMRAVGYRTCALLPVQQTMQAPCHAQQTLQALSCRLVVPTDQTMITSAQLTDPLAIC